MAAAFIPVAILYVALALLVYSIGSIISIELNKKSTGLNNQQLTNAGTTYVQSDIADCVAAVEAQNITQDQKAALITDCNRNNLGNWLDKYQKSVYPDADHTPLTTGITNVNSCNATYMASAKTAADYAAFKACLSSASTTAIQEDQKKTLEVYKPTAPATLKEVPTPWGTYILIAAGLGIAYLFFSSKGTRSAVYHQEPTE